MARIEFNLWDAQEVLISENQIVVNCVDSQFVIVLPMDIQVPPYTATRMPIVEIHKEMEMRPILCDHKQGMHRLQGGCNAPGCICTKSRFDSEECEGMLT